MAGRTRKEAADNFVTFLDETISCVTAEKLMAFQQSDKLYRVFSNPPLSFSTRSGARLSFSILQVFSVGTSPEDRQQFKVKTREYSYRLANAGGDEILSYHWHPLKSDLRHPHLHVGRVPRVAFSNLARLLGRYDRNAHPVLRRPSATIAR